MKYKHLLLALLAGSLWFNTSAQPKRTKSFQTSGLHFVENKGQVLNQHQNARSDIDFKLQAANGLNLFIGSGQLHYQFIQPLQAPKVQTPIERLMPEEQDDVQQEYALYRLDVELIGANPNAQIIREDPLAYYERYFLPWVNTTHDNQGKVARSYQKITYKDIYPNIDWVFYFNAQGQLEHDFLVHPNGNIKDIKMRYSGSTALNLRDDGSLQALTPMGKITENAPYAYTQDGKPVASTFVLDGEVLSFKTDDYTGTLIIDPVIEWGTYFGGTGDEEAGDITTDAWGNVYLCGITTSMSNIATTGAFQDTLVDNDEAFLSKWNAEGVLLWATYYGGEEDEYASAVRCDGSGNVYIGGGTNSLEGISTAGSYQPVKGGNPIQKRDDGFLVKFDSSGSRLWGTYLGGINQDASTALSIAIDLWDNIYATGDTRSTDFPVTAGTHQATKAGSNSSRDAFIAKFDTNGQLQWSSFYGGDSHEYPYENAVDASGNLYIAGYTQSENGISTSNAFQPSHGGGQDAFLAKFDSTGQQIWGTYYGGSDVEQCRAMAIGLDKVVLGGVTTSSNGIASINAHQNTFGGGSQDGFVAAFDLDGQQLWATYYGGLETDNLSGGVWCPEYGSVYVCGYTFSGNQIATAGSLQNTLSGLYDVCLVKFEEDGSRVWGTYIGGSDVDEQPRLTLDGHANIYIAGKTNSASNIATPSGYQTGLNGSYDAFLIRINDCEAPDLPGSIQGEVEVCSGTEQVYTISPDSLTAEYVWLLPLGWVGESDSNSIFALVGDNGGEIQLIAISACGGVSDTQTLSVTVLPSPEPKIVEVDFILSATQLYESYQWLLNGEDIPGATDPVYLAEEDGYYQVSVMNADSCFGISDSLLVQGASDIGEVSTSIDVRLYPNPSSGLLFLDSKVRGFIQGFNLEGKKIVMNIPFEEGLNRFNLGHLPTGMYLIKVVTDEGVKVVKWVRK